MRVLLHGFPCSGKSTLAELICTRYPRVDYISVGKLMQGKASLSSRIMTSEGSIMVHGQDSYPGRFFFDLVYDRVRKSRRTGFILDGYPKRPTEVPEVMEVFNKLSLTFTGIVGLRINLENAIQRASTRLVCPACGLSYNRVSVPPARPGYCNRCSAELVQRFDDTPDQIAKRYREYLTLTWPAVQELQSLNAGYTYEIGSLGIVDAVRTILTAEGLYPDDGQ